MKFSLLFALSCVAAFPALASTQASTTLSKPAPQARGFPLEDPPFEEEKVEMQCTPTSCLPITFHGLGAPLRHQKVYWSFEIPGLTRHELYFTVKDMRATVDSSSEQIQRLQRISGMMGDIATSDQLYPFREQITKFLNDDMIAWGMIKEKANQYLSAASKSSNEKRLFTNEFVAKVKANYRTKKPLLRPEFVAYPLGEDIIRNMRSAFE